MRTRLDVDGYRALTDEQRAAVDDYLADGLGLPWHVYYVLALEATGEGTVRAERFLRVASDGFPRWAWVLCPGCGRPVDPVIVRQTVRPAVPPPWLAWPDPTEEADPDAC